MAVIIVDKFKGVTIRTSDFIPRMGDHIDLGYIPILPVTKIVLWPSKETLTSLGIVHRSDIDAIVFAGSS